MEGIHYYILNSEKIVFEKFDDETVLINLEKGNYYGVMNLAKIIIELLEEGIAEHDLVSILENYYEIDSNEIRKDVHDFFSFLLNEGVVLSKEGQINLPKIDFKDGIKYIKPIIEVYSDMQDLILLDPVHDVNGSSWPNVKKDEE